MVSKTTIIIVFIHVLLSAAGCSRNCMNGGMNTEGIEILTCKGDGLTYSAIMSVQCGWTMEQLSERLGHGLVGDPPTVSVMYPAQEGGNYEVLFFTMPDEHGEVYPTNAVIAVYHSIPNEDGHFILPQKVRGKTWKSVFPH